MNTESRKYTSNSWHGKGPFKALIASGRMKNGHPRIWIDHLDTGKLPSGQKEFISHPYMSLQDAVLNCQEDFDYLTSVGWIVVVSEDSEYHEATIRISITEADTETMSRLLVECNGRIEVLTQEVKELHQDWMNSQDCGGRWLDKSAELDQEKTRKRLLSLKRR